MKKLTVLSLIALLLAAPATATRAQGPGQEPGSGGTIVMGFVTGTMSLESLNPLRGDNTDSYDTIAWLMFPSVVGVSPYTQFIARVGEEGVFNALATDWTVSDDLLTWTFTLRQDAVWSDGAPITARDVKFSFEAIASREVGWSYGGAAYHPDFNRTAVKEVIVVDDYTVQAVLAEANCDGVLAWGFFPVIPAHVFGYDGNPDFDFSMMVGHPYDTNPSVVYGPFQLDYFHLGEGMALKPVPTWAEAPVVPTHVVFRDVIDAEDYTRRFLAGEFDYIDSPLPCMSCFDDILSAPNVTAISFPGSAWDYIALNIADPTNPQPGEDAQGNRIDQGHHPLFGDVRVRRALQLAIDVPEIIQKAASGVGTPMASSQLPTSWAADPTLDPVPYDPALAAQLLDEAGWPLGPDGVRVCQGCKYAVDGTRFEFELVTNEGNQRRATTGALVRERLARLGIVVDFYTIDFGGLLDVMKGQRFDALLVGWAEGFPTSPDRSWIFGSWSDVLPAGNNISSYYNPEFDRLSRQALAVPGCDPGARAAIYHQIDRILQADPPYLWLNVQNQLYAAHDYVVGFDPQPNMPFWNIHTWRVERP